MKDKKEFANYIKNQILSELKKHGLSELSNIFDSIHSKYLSEITKYGIKDPEQSWKSFKGNLL